MQALYGVSYQDIERMTLNAIEEINIGGAVYELCAQDRSKVFFPLMAWDASQEVFQDQQGRRPVQFPFFSCKLQAERPADMIRATQFSEWTRSEGAASFSDAELLEYWGAYYTSGEPHCYLGQATQELLRDGIGLACYYFMQHSLVTVEMQISSVSATQLSRIYALYCGILYPAIYQQTKDSRQTALINIRWYPQTEFEYAEGESMYRCRFELDFQTLKKCILVRDAAYTEEVSTKLGPIATITTRTENREWEQIHE